MVSELKLPSFGNQLNDFSEIVSAGGKGRIPWAQLRENQDNFILPEYLPDGYTLTQYCYVFALSILHHKQRYYRTASFLYHDPITPHLLLLTIWRHCYLRYEDLFHCTFPSVIQGPLSLYDYIGIWYDTIYPHTPTSSTIHIGLAYVGLDRSSI